MKSSWAIILKTKYKNWSLCRTQLYLFLKQNTVVDSLVVSWMSFHHRKLIWFCLCHSLNGCFGLGLGICPKLAQLDWNAGLYFINVETQGFFSSYSLLPNANKDNLYPQRKTALEWTANHVVGQIDKKTKTKTWILLKSKYWSLILPPLELTLPLEF